MATPVINAGSVARPRACDSVTERMPISRRATPTSCGVASLSPSRTSPTMVATKATKATRGTAETSPSRPAHERRGSLSGPPACPFGAGAKEPGW